MQIIEHLKLALSVRQPNVELMLRGVKRFEYRSRATRIRERVYLYASKTLAVVDGFDEQASYDLPYACIVGSILITDCARAGGAHGGCFAWSLAEPMRYAKPMLAKNVALPMFWRPVF